MSDRVCAECESTITDDAPDTVLFCSEHCTLQYLADNDDVPEAPRYA